jgi:type I restriction enzyme S subunit
VKWTTLEDVSTLVSKGTTPTTLGAAFISQGIPFLRAEDVIGTAINPKAVAFCISEETNKLLSRSQLQPGDLLITIAGTLGRIGYVPMNAPPLNCNQAVAFVRLKPQVIDLIYASFACQAQIADLLTLRKIGTIGNLNLEQVRQFRIPLPPLSEQNRIATLLSRAERLCRARRYALELTDTFLPAAFHMYFGDARANTKHWDSVTLGELLIRGPQNGIYKPASAYGAGTPILRIDSFYDGVVTRLDSLKRVRLLPDDIECFGLSENDIVVNRVNSRPYLGKSALIPRLNESTVFESNMMRLTLNTKSASPVYMTHYLQTSFVKSQIQVLAKDAVNQSSINQEDVKGLTLRLPPLPLQQRFAKFVERVEPLRAVQREALRQAEHLFASLLYYAFSG